LGCRWGAAHKPGAHGRPPGDDGLLEAIDGKIHGLPSVFQFVIVFSADTEVAFAAVCEGLTAGSACRKCRLQPANAGRGIIVTTQAEAARELPRVLGLADVVLLYAVAIVGPQWLSTAAQAGASSLALWGLALLAVFLPCGFAVMEMNSRYAGEGGLYVWVKQAFGDLHGFVCGWCYVVSNFVFFPTLLLFLTAAAAYGIAAPGLKDDYAFNATLSVAVIWFVVVANIFGLGRAKWIPSAGAVVMALVLVMLVIAALALVRRTGSATAFAGALLPDLSDGALVKACATMMFGLVGYELAPLMGAEIREPRRAIPRAIVLSGVVIAAFYIGGTWSLLAALPKDKIDALSGVPEAMGTIAA